MGRVRISPSPQRGEGWGEGERAAASVHPWGPFSDDIPPHPTLSPAGRGLFCPISACEQFLTNDLQDGLGVREHVSVPESKHPVSERFDDFGARRIELRRVLTAVQLNREVGVAAGEIRDEPRDGELAEEFGTLEAAAAQVVPKAVFGFSASAAQVAPDRCQLLLRQGRTPSPQPSPRRGEGVSSARRLRSNPLRRKGEGLGRFVNA